MLFINAKCFDFADVFKIPANTQINNKLNIRANEIEIGFELKISVWILFGA